jgi:predicted transposase/invertase (TIGR01784 family)
MTVLLKDNPAIGRAHEVYQEFTNNEELMDMAEAREKWQKDVNSKLHSAEQRGKEAGIQEGIQEGIQQGIQEGIQQARLEDAQRMLAEGIDISTVQRITGLSENQVLELKDN